MSAAEHPAGWAWERLGLSATQSAAKRALADNLITSVCEAFALRPEHLMRSPERKGRDLRAVLPRFLTMYLLKTDCDWSYSKIAVRLGYQDHTSVSYGAQRVQQMLEGGNAAVAAVVETVRDHALSMPPPNAEMRMA